MILIENSWEPNMKRQRELSFNHSWKILMMIISICKNWIFQKSAFQIVEDQWSFSCIEMMQFTTQILQQIFVKAIAIQTKTVNVIMEPEKVVLKLCPTHLSWCGLCSTPSCSSSTPPSSLPPSQSLEQRLTQGHC